MLLIEVEVIDWLGELTERFTELENSLVRTTAETRLEQGKILLEIKERLPHGEFTKWLKQFGWKPRTARHYMDQLKPKAIIEPKKETLPIIEAIKSAESKFLPDAHFNLTASFNNIGNKPKEEAKPEPLPFSEREETICFDLEMTSQLRSHLYKVATTAVNFAKSKDLDAPKPIQEQRFHLMRDAICDLKLFMLPEGD